MIITRRYWSWSPLWQKQVLTPRIECSLKRQLLKPIV
jgi:hypothetical protein